MRVVICDRCGKKIMRKDKAGYINLDWRDLKTGDLDGDPTDLCDWDFCDDCMNEINKFVRVKPKGEETEPEKSVGGGTNAPDQPAVKTAAKIDVGKIRALAAAGWPAKEIAKEVGCSEPTVYKYMKGDNA